MMFRYLRQKVIETTEKKFKQYDHLIYKDTSYLVPTSSIFEHLLSKAGHLSTNRMKGVQPKNLKAQLTGD